jgi:hypothetical protein
MKILEHKPGHSTYNDYIYVVKKLGDTLLARVANGENPVSIADEFVKRTGEHLRSAFYDFYYYVNTEAWKRWIKKFRSMISLEKIKK